MRAVATRPVANNGLGKSPVQRRRRQLDDAHFGAGVPTGHGAPARDAAGDVDVIPIAEPEFTKTAVDDPLHKVPPARRGNRAGAPFAVPLAKRGEPKGGGQL
jgi:hypothetical protein